MLSLLGVNWEFLSTSTLTKRVMLVFETSRSLVLFLLLYSTNLTVAHDTPDRQPADRATIPTYPPHRRTTALPPFYIPPFVGALYCVLNPDWTIDFHAFHNVLPLATAAATLLSFYEDIAAIAATTTVSTADRYICRVGQITLEIRSALGVFPLVEVVGFANWMRENTKRGFIGTYQVNFVHRNTGKLVTMSLWVGILRWG